MNRVVVKRRRQYVSQQHLIDIMNTENSQQPLEASPEYTTPVLMRHGTMAELTNSNATTGGDGGGDPAYSSSLG